MRVHLIDGTYELFRYHFGAPAEVRAKGGTAAATRGVVGSMLTLLEQGATHIGVATDHVIESFRNDLYPGYKTGEGVDPELKAQFPVVEAVLQAMGVVVWPMVELEADDGLASAAATLTNDERIEQIIIASPDKDLGQCVVGDRVVQLDRRKEVVTDEAGIKAKYGIGPTSIPDWLALVGDSADGFPGLPGWGSKAASGVLKRYPHIEDIPRMAERWDVDVRGARTLANCLHDHYDEAMLYRELATLRIDPDLCTDVETLRWTGPPDPASFAEACEHLGVPRLPERAAKLAARRAALA